MAVGFGSVGTASTNKITTGYTSNTTGLRSFSIWVNRQGVGGGNLGRFWDKGPTATIEQASWDTGSNKIVFDRVWTGNGQWNCPAPSSGTWHHVGITYDAGSTANLPQFYIDGVLQTTTVNTGPTGSLVNNSDAYVIGNRGSDNVRVFDGYLRDFAIWDGVVLTADEFAALAGGGLPHQIRPGSLVLNYPLYDLATAAVDLVPANGLGTISGCATYVQDPPIQVYRLSLPSVPFEPGADTTFSLVGIASDAAVGSFPLNTQYALTGISADAALGNLTPVAPGGLTGVSSTAALGTFGTINPGSLSFVSAALTGITLTSTNPTGGAAPIYRQLYRSTETGFTPGPEYVVPGIGGASMVDRTVRPGVTYYYKLGYRDATGNEQFSNQVNGTVPALVVMFIGTSITQGVSTSSGTGTLGNATAMPLGGVVGNTKTFLSAMLGGSSVTTVNRGVSGSQTHDWVTGLVPATNYYPAAAAAGLAAGANLVHIELGTNDAHRLGTAASVLEHMTSLIAQLKADFPTAPIIISFPFWLDGVRVNGGGANPTYNSGTNGNITSYEASLLSLIDNRQVFLGDVSGRTAINASNEGSSATNGFLADGVHLNDAGAAIGGALWAAAIYRVLVPDSPLRGMRR